MTAPQYPAWEERIRIDDEGWIGVASLPCHNRMPQEWKFKIFKPDGTPAYQEIDGLNVKIHPLNGPHPDDVTQAEWHLHQLLASAKDL